MQQHVYGYHSIEETLKRGIKNGVLLYSEEKGRRGHLINLAQANNIPVKKVNESELDGYCEKNKHRGVIFVYDKVQEHKKQDLKSYNTIMEKENALILLLDEITDPHNYGAILRSADQFNVDLVITPGKKSVRETDIVAVTSAGAHAYVEQLVIPNLVQAIEYLQSKGFWVYGTDMKGEPIHKTDLKGKVALVMGSEGKGLRSILKKHCDQDLSIPCHGHIDSLNVSVATGIILYEIRRQQGLK
ncbi:MAG: 23S rRNA (guanosine(2251)-2'-O)-methyltransferase RlmB [Spirochaetales bacterium]|nr:23S rRNA (guanosine(2251)-2'-O)-methyltransferase RlmB [Spirochaetales bacterium]